MWRFLREMGENLMTDTKTDNIRFLMDAKGALVQLEGAKQEVKDQEENVKRLQKSLATERKAVSDSIEVTIRKRRAEIAESFDVQIDETQSQLKKARTQRDKAKRAGVKARMHEETSKILEDNRQLNKEIYTLFRQNGVPRFCHSFLFYALFLPGRFVDILAILAALVLVLFLIPYGVFFFLPTDETLILAGIYVLDVLIFGGIYLLINNKVKIGHMDSLREGRNLRRQIRANRKQIRVTHRKIRKDKNEEMYGLEEFDETIRRLDQEKTEITEQKTEALNTFEDNGRVLLTQEITENNRERLAELEEKGNQASRDLEKIQSRLKALSLEATEKYESLLGKEFFQEEKIDLLIEAFEVGGAVNITDAQEMVRTGKTRGNTDEAIEAGEPAGLLTENADGETEASADSVDAAETGARDAGEE